MSLSLDKKLEIISRIKSGENLSVIGYEFEIDELTVSTIRAKKEDIDTCVQHSRLLVTEKIKYIRHPLLVCTASICANSIYASFSWNGTLS